MKLVIAYIRQYCLETVHNELTAVGLDQASIVADAWGQGHEKQRAMTFRGAVIQSRACPRARLEIAVEEDMVDEAILAIRRGAHTGAVGDGRIFVMNLDECINIRTGERKAAQQYV